MKCKVEERRKELGMTQVELSAKSGVSRPTIIELEKNTKTEIKLSTISKLAKALDCEPGDLIFSA